MASPQKRSRPSLTGMLSGDTSRFRALSVAFVALGLVAALFVHPGLWDAVRGPLPAIPSKPFRLGLDLQGGSHLVYEADMSGIAEGERREQLNGLREVIERRVNAFGVSEPLVQTAIVGDDYRLIVDLAGILDVEEAIRKIGETPLLEFKEVSTEPSRPLTAEEQKRLADSDAEAKKKAQDVITRLDAGEDFAALAKELSDDPGSKEQGGDLGWFGQGEMVAPFQQAVEQLAKGSYTKTPVATDFGYHVIRKTDERETAGPEVETAEGETLQSTVTEWQASHILIAKLQPTDIVPAEQWKGSGLTGRNLKRANVLFDQQTGAVQIGLQFDAEGADIFAEITKRNVGRPLAIFIDGEMIGDPPVVQQEIIGGEAQITGRFTIPEAKQMVRNLNAGALPVPIALVNQQTVGPTLGAASLEKSLMAGFIGFLVVVVFMVGFYRFLGLLASLALAVYAALTLAVFKSIDVTLTLAGIAGFILSMGMAVDANILIFERFKEEMRAGKPVRQAIEEGFRRAWLSIRDSNVSSLITCAILAWLGTSLVKGFAVTLAIGIIVSMFTAILVTRGFLMALAGGWMEKRGWLIGVRSR